jgi:hypothetical protein
VARLEVMRDLNTVQAAAQAAGSGPPETQAGARLTHNEGAWSSLHPSEKKSLQGPSRGRSNLVSAFYYFSTHHLVALIIKISSVLATFQKVISD